MFKFVASIFFFVVLASAKNIFSKRLSKCYGKLGCLSTDGFFSIKRPINFLPASRESINTQFQLYTRKNMKVHTLVRADYPQTLAMSNFDSSKPTKFLVHGFTDNGFKLWILSMKDEFMKYGDLNVFIVDWGSGSRLPYTQATANTRLVGAEIAYFIKFLEKTVKFKRSDAHIIGHSLGAHIGGYAGARLPGLARITGLDPAGPYFEKTPPLVRLDPSDATFVDTIHSNARRLVQLGFGIIQPCGHVDYYPNGGNNQPGCKKNPLSFITAINKIPKGVRAYMACNHMMSTHYFTESINSKCGFPSYKCSSYSDFQAQKCSPAVGAHMGLHADQYIPTNGETNVKLYLETSKVKPDCLENYQVNLRVGLKRGKAILYVQLVGTQSKTSLIQLTDRSINLDPEKNLSFLVKNKEDIGDIVELKLRWKYKKNWLKPWTWIRRSANNLLVSKIEVIDDDAVRKMFCHKMNPSIKKDYTESFKLSRSC